MYLEGLFVCVHVISHVCLLGLAEENEVLEQEYVAETLLLPEGDQELILANQLPLLLQVDLSEKRKGHASGCLYRIHFQKPRLKCILGQTSDLDNLQSTSGLTLYRVRM